MINAEDIRGSQIAGYQRIFIWVSINYRARVLDILQECEINKVVGFWQPLWNAPDTIGINWEMQEVYILVLALWEFRTEM